MKKMKTKTELLAAFKKANKVRRVVIANRAGFDTTEEYVAHLQKGIEADNDSEPVTAEKVSTNKGDVVVHNVHLVDGSSSMSLGGRFNSVLEGMKSEIKELSEDKDTEYIQSIMMFSNPHMYTTATYRQRLGQGEVKMPRFTGGMTALYDAIVKTIHMLIENKHEDEVTVLKIFTDGGENASRDFMAGDVRKSIERAESAGITVTFVGTEYDVESIIANVGVNSSNTMSHNNTGEDITRAYGETIMATKSFVAKAKAGEDTLTGFYKQTGKL